MKKKLIIFLCITLAIVFIPQVRAQAPQSTLRVSPVIINVNLSPGKTYTYDITVSNMSHSPLPATITFDNFDTDETGKEITFPDKVDNSILSWVSAEPKNLLIPAGERRTVKLTIQLPRQIPLGGYYGVMFVEPVFNQASQSSLVNAKVGVLMLANVGVTDKNPSIDLVESTNDKHLYMSGPVKQILRIKNNSLNHFTAKPRILVEPFFGKKITYQFEDKVIFPGKIRRWDTSFELPDYYHGYYKTTLRISTGNGHELSYSGYIIGFPMLTVSFFLAIGAITVFTVIYRKRVKKALAALLSK